MAGRIRGATVLYANLVQATLHCLVVRRALDCVFRGRACHAADHAWRHLAIVCRASLASVQLKALVERWHLRVTVGGRRVGPDPEEYFNKGFASDHFTMLQALCALSRSMLPGTSESCLTFRGQCRV